MEIVEVTTAQNIKIEYPLAGLGARVKARCIDLGIFFMVYWVCMMIFVGTTMTQSPGAPPGGTAFLVIMIICGTLGAIYDPIMEIFFNGQSIGKRVSKIRVISISGERPSVGQYLLRWVFRFIDFGITLGSLAVVMVSFSDKKQRIGDLIAGTTVVSTEPVTQYKELIFGEPEPGHVPVYNQVLQLTDRDIALIYEVIKNFNRSRNNLLIYRLAMRVKTFLQVSYPPDVNEYQFLETIVSDYKSLVNNIDA